MTATSAGKEWDVLWAGETAMPVHLLKKGGLKWMLMPQLTQHITLVSEHPEQVASAPMAQRLNRYCRKRHVAYCCLQGDWKDDFLREAVRQGFTVHPRITYQIERGQTREQIIAGLSENKHRQLKRAMGMQLRELDVDTFYRFHRDCLASRGKKIRYEAALAQSVLNLPEVRLLGAWSKDGVLLAAVALAYDGHTCYYLLPTYREETKKSGAMAWLTVEAVGWAMEQGMNFDFEGSMVPSIARSYREFGGKEAKYYCIEKFYNPLVKWWLRLRK